MTLEQFGTLSNYLMVSATCILALAFICHVAEWAFARKVESPELDGAGAPVSADAEAADVPVSGSERLSAVGVSLTGLATLLLLLSVLTRGLAAERVPWGNMYEFGLAGSTIALTVYLVLVRLTRIEWLGLIVTGFALAVLGMSISTYVPPGPLVPALHSYWLVIHVAAVMIAGALFLVGGGASLLYLVQARAEERGIVSARLRRLPTAATMDQLAYRVNAFAFPLWTFGALIAGPIWAHYAWGRYWGWDPKEVWAFITWVVYAGYLHARATAGWKGRRAAIFCLIGFATFLFSFYGVNLNFFGLFDSQHGYAK